MISVERIADSYKSLLYSCTESDGELPEITVELTDGRSFRGTLDLAKFCNGVLHFSSY